MNTKLIGYPCAAVAWEAPKVISSVEAIIRLRGGRGARINQDIVGGTGRGARVIRDSLGTVTLGTSAGRGASAMFQYVTKGRGRKRRLVRVKLKAGAMVPNVAADGSRSVVVAAHKGAARGRVIGKRVRAEGQDKASDAAARLASWLRPSMSAAELQAQHDRLAASGAEVFAPFGVRPGLAVERTLARRDIAAAVVADELPGRTLLAIGARAAHKQAGKLAQLRGVQASATSIQDAAADAVSSILASVRRLDKVPARLWRSTDCEPGCGCEVCRFRRVLAIYAGRGAFNSLCHWATAGTTGDNTSGKRGAFGARAGAESLHQGDAHQGDARGVVFVELTGAACESARYGVALPMVDERMPAHDDARRALVRWVFQVGLRDFMASVPAGKGAGQVRAGARRRCRVVGSVVFGASIADACAMAGWASVGAWVKSCKEHKFFESLTAARAKSLRASANVRELQAAMRGAALQAAAAVRWMRLASPVWQAQSGAVARRVTLPSGGAVARQVHPRLVRVSPPAFRRTVAPSTPGLAGTGAAQAGFEWLRAADARERFTALAVAYRKAWQSIVKSNLAAFGKVLGGIHTERFGDLSVLLGHKDKRGRARSRARAGINPAFIGKARGKVSRRVALAPAVTVPHNGGKLACAVSVGGVQPWATEGASGFTVANPKR